MNLSYYFLIFMIYSFIGWCMEVMVSILGDKKKFVNRGFMIGPYCPIYGSGGIIITLLLTNMEQSPFAVFSSAMVLCAVLEYVISYVMEKIFNVRWWDYNNFKFNINGRICLETTIPFGLLGCFIIYVSNPFLINIFSYIPSNILNIISIVLATVFVIDFIVSTKIVFSFRKTTKLVLDDSTEEVSKKVKETILDKLNSYKRLLNAFPNVKNQIENIVAKHNPITKVINSIRKKAD